jgi:hypothetical protein
LQSSDTAYFNRIADLGMKSGNRFYQNRLDLLKAMHNYFIHRTGDAFSVIKNHAVTTLNNLEYYRILGKLSLREGKAKLAAEFLEQTDIRNNAQDRFYYSLALLESGSIDTARSILNALVSSGDPDIAAVSEEYLSVLSFDGTTSVGGKSDEFIYLLSCYHPSYQQDSTKENLMEHISSLEIKSLLQLEYLKSLIQQQKFESAGQYYSLIASSSTLPQFLDDFRRIAYLIDIHQLNAPNFINETGLLDINDPNYLYDVLLDALRHDDQNDSISREQKFIIAGTWDPFFETGILQAVDYYHTTRKDDYFAYNLLIEATEINRYSIPLYKEMIDLTLKMGMVEYALDALEILKGILPEQAYSDYQEEILSRIREKQDRMPF